MANGARTIMAKCPEPLPECLVRLQAIETSVQAIWKAVAGNGDPTRSLIDRVARLETTLKVLAAVVVIGIAAASALAAWR